jgi:hypothetical protein
MGIFDGVPLVGLSAPALLSIVVLLLLTGRLVPRATLLDKTKESDRWREAYEKEREARGSADAQSRELLEVSKTTHHIVEALFNSTHHARGGTDVLP